MDSLAFGVWTVHSEISSVEFEMQDLSNLKILLILPTTILLPLLRRSLQPLRSR